VLPFASEEVFSFVTKAIGSKEIIFEPRDQLFQDFTHDVFGHHAAHF